MQGLSRTVGCTIVLTLLSSTVAAFSDYAGAASQSLGVVADEYLGTPCLDTWGSCAGEAARGECAANPGFMLSRCPASCGTCDDVDFRTFRNMVEALLYSARNAARATNVSSSIAVASLEYVADHLGDVDETRRKAALRAAAALVATAAERAAASEEIVPSPLLTGGLPPASLLEHLAMRGTKAQKHPAVGFGTWQLSGDALIQALKWAIAAGTRHIDTAEAYHNEKDVGVAIAAVTAPPNGVSREVLFITTKVAEASFNNARRAIDTSLRNLNVEYIDCILLHGPGANGAVRAAAWRELERAHNEGLVRAIGVSNFDVRQLNELEAIAVVPIAVVQNELDPLHHRAQEAVLDWCEKRGVIFVAYSSLAKWPFALASLNDAHVAAAARSIGAAPSDIILRWALQLRVGTVAVIPKATSRDHVAANAPPSLLATPLPTGVFDFISTLASLARSPWNRGAGEYIRSGGDAALRGNSVDAASVTALPAALAAAFAPPARASDGRVQVTLTNPRGAPAVSLFWLPPALRDNEIARCDAMGCAGGVEQGVVNGGESRQVETWVGHRFWTASGGVVHIIASVRTYTLGAAATEEAEEEL